MSQINSGSPSQKKSATSNVYTALLFVAFVVLAAAVVYILIRTEQLFGSYNPFAQDEQASAAGHAVAVLLGLA